MLCIIFICANVATPQSTTAFTYQGRLQDNGISANGNYDFEFKLYDQLSDGTQQGATITLDNVQVANGIFTVQLDFGANAFANGQVRYLEIGVRSGASLGAFTLLTPRQQIMPAPYAIRSQSSAKADNATTAMNADKLGGVDADMYIQTNDPRLSDSRMPTTGSDNYIQNSATLQANSNFNISGNGTAGGTLSGNAVNAVAQFNLGGSRLMSAPGINNIFVGIGAGAANTTGAANSFFGKNAGVGTTSGDGNSFFGSASGYSNAKGRYNSFFGANAGQTNADARFNSFFGASAGRATNSGEANSFFGFDSGVQNTGGQYNSFFGFETGSANTTGSFNSFLGQEAGYNNETGSGNTFIGNRAGDNQTTGDGNTYIGSSAKGKDGISNSTAIGTGAFVNASNTMVLGTSATTVQIPGNLNVTGSIFSVAQFNGSILGATQFNLNGTPFIVNQNINNAVVGFNSGGTNSSGVNNTFIGSYVATTNTTGGANVFVGTRAGHVNTTGSSNAFLGMYSGYQNTTGNLNVFIGAGAGSDNTVGNENSFAGAEAGMRNQTGNKNAFFGRSAGLNNISGEGNTFIGKNAGQSNMDGSNNTYIGTGANGSASLTNATAIGANAFVGENNTMVLGTSAVTVKIPGILSIAGTQLSLGGFRALSIAGSNNFFAGIDAGINNAGNANTFVGTSSGKANTNGYENTFVGALAGRDNIDGINNTFVGSLAGVVNTTGNRNAFMGRYSGLNNSTGSFNVFIGNYAGVSNTTEDNNTFLGSETNGVSGITNATAIGASARVTQSNSVILGNNASIGIGTPAPKAKLDVTGGNILVSSAGSGIILKSPNGTVCRMLTIDNTGALIVSNIVCPQ